MLYDVREIKSSTVVQRGEEIPSPRGHMKEAVLSDTFIAFISDSSLEVHEYSLPLKTNRVGKQHVFELESSYQWDPSCLALHEEQDRAWVAVGGGIVRGEAFHGDIKLFQIDKFSMKKKLLPQTAKFCRSDPDPLRGGPLKRLSFGPEKSKLGCVTNNNHVLIWPLSNNAQPRGNPFKITNFYSPVRRIS